MPNYSLQRAFATTAKGESFTDSDITSRFKNKFQNGWLGGVGSDSQFQSLNQIGVLPFNTNNDMAQRISSSIGDSAAGLALLPSWRRSYAWNVGLGTDALQSKITFTSKNAGLLPQTSLVAPLVNAGHDATNTGPITPFQNYTAGQMMQAPTAITGGEGAECVQERVQSEIQRANMMGRRHRKD